MLALQLLVAGLGGVLGGLQVLGLLLPPGMGWHPSLALVGTLSREMEKRWSCSAGRVWLSGR